MSEVVGLAQALMRAPSVTPANGPVFDVLEAALVAKGFSVDRFINGSAPDGPVENLFATRAGVAGGTHFAFAGHLDVVPPGEGWTSGAFEPEIRGELLFGRGAVDMKGGIAAFVAAIPEDAAGRISLIITGDEEGPAVFGTRAIIDHMVQKTLVPDLCLVGEPTSVSRLGDMIKIGRRGSVNIWITVNGMQGHVAYPHLADNPIPRLLTILAALGHMKLDEGTDWFQASNCEITDLEVGNRAHNVIPAAANARLSIRFNDLHTGDGLIEQVREIARSVDPEAVVTGRVSGEAFLTPPGDLSSLISQSIEDVAGITPELSTSGGTSDARFLSKLCPVVEFGLPNATMHKLDEAVAIADLEQLVQIYRRVIERALSLRSTI